MTARALLFALLAAALPQIASASAVLVERDLSWTKSASGQTAPATLLIFDGARELFAIETKLTRRGAGKPVSLDLDHGYRLYCGEWTSPAPDQVTVQAELLESYRYAALEEKRQFAAHFATAGATPGALPTTLTEGSRVFEMLPTLRLGETEVGRFRLACHHGK